MTNSEGGPMSNTEKEHLSTKVELIAPDGLGYGEGGISIQDQLKRHIITEETPVRVQEVLLNDSRVFRNIEATDDGCGDGRPWQKIIQTVEVDGEKKVQFYGKSLLRAKVFGGGLVAASSMWRTINGQPGDTDTVGQDRAFVAEQLAKHDIAHGAHSDDHAHGDSCGCGAIDKYPQITANAIKFRPQITEVLRTMYGDDFENNKQAIEQTFDTYGSLASTESYFQDGSGKQSIEQLLESGAVVKELYGNHVEETVIINDVPGTTLDQQYFTQTVKNACVEDVKPQIIQAFSVDVWRGKMLADVVAEVAKEQDSSRNIEKIKQLAMADFLIRTLAVAGTLTAGDLPVYRRQVA